MSKDALTQVAGRAGVCVNEAENTVDLTDRLRFAAGSLAADFGEELSVDHAETLVFSSAEGLLSAASVTEFVPILAERRARLAVRSAVRDEPAVLPAIPVEYVPAPAPPAPPPAAHSEPLDVVPLLAVPDRDVTRLRNDLERVRMRVSDWRADLGRRHEG